MPAEIEAEHLTKRFGDLVALSDLSLKVAPGEVFGLIGPNGAGKTTFLRILTGFWLPSQGDVRVDGESVLEHRYSVQERLGYVCEQPKLYMDHRVDSFLGLMGELRGLGGTELEQAVERGIERFGLHEVRRRRIGVLSKGFRQRVSLAQAMIHDPPLVVIDEPTVGLDPRQQLELRRTIQDFGGQRTVLLCTHNLHEAATCCDRVGLLDRGRLIRISAADEIRDAPIAYVVLTAFVSLSGVYFFQHLVNYNRLLFIFHSQGLGTTSFDQGTVPLQVNSLDELFIPFAGDLNLFLLAVIPLITMRVFAEERSQGTDELLLTTPLRSWEVALAKHATTYVFVMLLLATSSIYPAIVIAEGRLGMAHLGALYVGQLGLGVAAASIGLACSSFTQSQLMAAIVAYAIPFVMLDFGWLEPALNEATSQLLRQVAIQSHLESFARGVVGMGHLVYFASAALLGFVVSMASLDLTRAR